MIENNYFIRFLDTGVDPRSSAGARFYFLVVPCSTADEERLDHTGTLGYNDGSFTGASSFHDQSGRGEGRLVDRRKMEGGDDNLASTNEEMPDHYIYVAYPPELKRRLLERYLFVPIVSYVSI